MSEHDFTVTTSLSLSRSRISDVLCGALDPQYGASYSWCSLVRKIEPTIWEFDSRDEMETVGYGVKENGPYGNRHFRQDFPLNPGGALILVEDDDENKKELTLDLKAVQAGLEKMAKGDPDQFQSIIEENDDAITSDILLQYALLGEVVYG